MKKNLNNLIFLNSLFIASLIIANTLAGKLVSIGIFEVPSAVLVYGITFLCTDIIGEIWGKEEANNAVKRGFLIQCFSLIMIFFAIKLKPTPYMIEYNEHFKAVFGQNARMVGASLVAYLVSQANDVLIFHKLKDATNGDKKWLRNNVSTMSSQFLDTAIFVTIAFYGSVPSLWVLVYSQYITKMVIALLDTPFFYYFTKEN